MDKIIQSIITCMLIGAVLSWLAYLLYKLFSLEFNQRHELKLEDLRQKHELKIFEKKTEESIKKMAHEIEMKKLNIQ
jgi:hypothetical protein